MWLTGVRTSARGFNREGVEILMMDDTLIIAVCEPHNIDTHLK